MTRTHLGRVLVVDDDDAIRRVCTRVLGGEGWQVTLAEHGRAAVIALDDNQVPFD